MSQSVAVNCLGFPRIGLNRELKVALEKYWKGEINQEELHSVGSVIRKKNWLIQQEKGVTHISSNDFTFYDQMLDTICLFGAIPQRFKWQGKSVDLDTYFAMARGTQEKDSESEKEKVFALEMLKWFDTNYHYLVPEFLSATQFAISSDKIFHEYQEARDLGVQTKPVLIGPITFLRLGKAKENFDKIEVLFPRLLPLYVEVVLRLAKLGADWIQIDEPAFVLDLSSKEVEAAQTFYGKLREAINSAQGNRPRVLLTTYFDDLGTNQSWIPHLPVDALHVDLTRGHTDLLVLAETLKKTSKSCVLSLGLVDGRNVWKTRYDEAVKLLRTAIEVLGYDRVWVGTSCSLIHSPISMEAEKKLPDFLKPVLSFAVEKLDELAQLRLLSSESLIHQQILQANVEAWNSFLARKELNNLTVRDRLSSLKSSDFHRKSQFSVRKECQKDALKLPEFPTTTIGSLPQTAEARTWRLKLRRKEITQEQYDAFIRKKIEEGIKFQEDIDIDVLVHGEFERNDMVEYFGENLQGFAFTSQGWVQSFGSRYVKPPIIFGDVSRPQSMTLKETLYAQSLTSRPVKGMLTGPITILQWSFVRIDQHRSQTAKQIALAILDEVLDLEKAGIRVIQVDEPALREGLPLKQSQWNDYLKWSSEAFRLSVSAVEDKTQIHTHMCYAEFADIIRSIADLDADVISIESSRSQMKLLRGTFASQQFQYPNQIGPGVFDIHSPRIPSMEEMRSLLEEAAKVIPRDQLWVNPDCGLKTRQWKEVTQQLTNMVAAAKLIRNH